MLETCYGKGIETVSLFAWSTENWSRPAQEVEYIMRALEEHLPGLLSTLDTEGVRLVHLGKKDQLSPSACELLSKTSERPRDRGPRTFALAFNCGGRDEIATAA